jgi:cytochrome c oxidase cbb3-type subunit 1
MGFLNYSFVETVMAMHPFYIIRSVGGVLYLAGAIIMCYNIYRTIKGDVAVGEVDKDGNPREAVTTGRTMTLQPAE